jgi:hypothetical protein
MLGGESKKYLFFVWLGIVTAIIGAHVADYGHFPLGLRISILGVVMLFWARHKHDKWK